MQKDEPNDDPFNPAELPNLGASDDPLMMMSQLDGAIDVDWFRFACSDATFGSLDPNFNIEVEEPIRVCVFLDCQQGGNPSFDCPAGTEEDTAPIDFLPGCCATGALDFEISNHNCPDSQNDAVDVYMRVTEGSDEACTPYAITHGC